MKKQTEHIELSQEQIIQKLESFCSYRERCTSEINQKLYQLKADANDFEFYINYLKENNFLNETVQQSLLQIDEGMYLIKLQDVLEKKNRQLKETDAFKRKQKLIQFAMQKGYEYEIINEAMKNIAF